MKKLLAIIPLLLVLVLIGCSSAEPEMNFIYKMGIKETFASTNCIGVFAEIENKTNNDVVPADVYEVKAFQNDVELKPVAMTDATLADASASSSTVKAGETGYVVWLFELTDESNVKIELPNNVEKQVALASCCG